MDSRRADIEAVKRQIAAVLRTPGDLVEAVSSVVSGEIRNKERRHVVTGAVRGALQVGSDLTLIAKGVVMGVARSTRGAAAALGAIPEVASGVVREAHELGGNAAAAARGAVEGAIEAAKETGADLTESASRAAEGALQAARTAGPQVLQEVARAVTGKIDGVRLGAATEFLRNVHLN